MTTDTLWAQLEGETPDGGREMEPWRLRLARPASDCRLFIAIEPVTRRRAILLDMAAELVPPQRHWPKAQGLEPLAIMVDGRPHFGVALKDRRNGDVFAALTEDLVRRVTDSQDPAAQVGAFLGQLDRWQRFLSVSVAGLGAEEQRGLWGELWFLREHLIAPLGAAAVQAWRGPIQAPQDFQFHGHAIEVKTTMASSPQVVRITSERQLENAGWTRLLLAVLSLEARPGSGETLPRMVASLRRLLGDSIGRESLEEALLASGYLDLHAGNYAEQGYLVRKKSIFHVSGAFPRITESSLPAGIGEVRYGLALDSCAAFELGEREWAEVLEAIRAESNEGRL